MPRRLLALLVGRLPPIPAAPALAAPADVRLRVEGSTATLAPRAIVRTDTRPVDEAGTRQETSYLLARRVPSRRCDRDVNAIDTAYNRDDVRRRGANRIVFHVA